VKRPLSKDSCRKKGTLCIQSLAILSKTLLRKLPVDLIYSVKLAIRPRAARAEVNFCAEMSSALLPDWVALGALAEPPDVWEPVAGAVFVGAAAP